MSSKQTVTERARAALQNLDLSMAAIARESGLPRSWLIAFRDGAIKQPGADRVEDLQTFLKKI